MPPRLCAHCTYRRPLGNMMKHMNIANQLIKISVLSIIFVYGCKSHVAPKEVDEFALFTATEIFDSVSGSYKIIPSVERLISIPKTQSLEEKVNDLLDSVSKNNFKNLKIEILRVEETQPGYKSLKVNLKENPGFIIPDSLGNYRSWYEHFQGSMGGDQTTIVLIESILQREYTGDWIDEVEFYYQGEKIVEWDHAFLSGKIKRE
jgi:hypothetical protein